MTIIHNIKQETGYMENQTNTPTVLTTHCYERQDPHSGNAGSSKPYQNTIPKIKINNANTHPNTCTERSTNKTRPGKTAGNGWQLGKERSKKKELKDEEIRTQKPRQ